MKLPDNAIGISDVLKYRECGRKFLYSMRRWQEGGQPPEDNNPRTLYGTIFHDTVSLIEEKDLSDEEAVEAAFAKYAAILEPADLPKIKADLQTYRERDLTGVRTIANELDVRVPLMEWEGETIYFRGQIDRLYQKLNDEAAFVHVDFKTSRWQKTEEEVHQDLQMWAYNWLIHEYWPECEELSQVYDQLRFGQVATRKSEAQRAEIKGWLIQQVTAILKDSEPQARFNRWCPYCPIKYDCPVIDRLSDFEVARINELSPDEPINEDLDLTHYVAKLDDVQTAIKTLEEYANRIKGVVRELPADRQNELGYSLAGRSFDVWDADALESAHQVLGDDFYRMVKLSKTTINNYLGEDERREVVLNLATKQTGTPQLRRRS